MGALALAVPTMQGVDSAESQSAVPPTWHAAIPERRHSDILL